MTSQHQEPPTSAKVIMSTTHGDLEVELWANECPKTCRNFLTLCLEGYYDQTIFHRIMSKFMIQGGDPTGTGNGGESIYGDPFENEIHMRLRFTHRGLLAMANLEENQNTSQFFFTYDSCPWLDKKNTIFGKIVGNTIFNLLAMEKLDTDSDDRPLIPPKILSTKIIAHPFKDLVVRSLQSQKKQDHKQEIQKPKIQQKLKKQVNLLSFQDDSENESNEQDQKINNAHDILKDKKLSKDAGEQYQKIQDKIKTQKEQIEKQEKLKKQVKLENEPKIIKNDDNKDLNQGLERVPGQLINGMKTKYNKKSGKTEIYYDKSNESQQSQDDQSYQSSDSGEYSNENTKMIRQKQKEEYDNLKIYFLEFKKDKMGTTEQQERGKHTEQKKLLSNLELRKLKFIQNKRVKLKESEVLKVFRSKKNQKHSKTKQTLMMCKMTKIIG